jgi:cytochrome P450
MNRKALSSITLSDGTILPSGMTLMISDDKAFDSETFSDPNKFDAERFLHLRQQSGEENRHQYVTTSSDHMGFGHGEHACPGRFFASLEIKIFLCVFLLNYDCRFKPGEKWGETCEFGTAMTVDPKTEIQIMARTPEIDLSAPLVE